MAKNRAAYGLVFLLFSAIAGLALASIGYLLFPEHFVLNTPVQDISFYRYFSKATGILLPLTLAFFLGFFPVRLPFLALLVLLRSFSLTVACYRLANHGILPLLKVLPVYGFQLYMLLCLCRLSLLFGMAQKRKGSGAGRHLLLFLCDYLFICGICCAIAATVGYCKLPI